MEKQFDAKPVLVYLVCDKCGGDMEDNGRAIDSSCQGGFYNLPKYLGEYNSYKCKECDSETRSSKVYPYVKHVRVEEE